MDQMIHLDLGKSGEDIKELIAALELSPDVVKAAIASALNKTMRTIRTSIIKKVAADTGARQKIIRARVNSRKASAKRTSSSLTMYVQSIPVSVFGFSFSKRSGIRTKAGNFRKAFFQRDVKSLRGKTRDKVLERQTGAGRYPLFERRIQIIDEAIAAFELNEKLVFELFHSKLVHEIRWRGGLLG